jgi:hypothetical protein
MRWWRSHSDSKLICLPDSYSHGIAEAIVVHWLKTHHPDHRPVFSGLLAPPFRKLSIKLCDLLRAGIEAMTAAEAAAKTAGQW